MSTASLYDRNYPKPHILLILGRWTWSFRLPTITTRTHTVKDCSAAGDYCEKRNKAEGR